MHGVLMSRWAHHSLIHTAIFHQVTAKQQPAFFCVLKDSHTDLNLVGKINIVISKQVYRAFIQDSSSTGAWKR
jgi:hypothetical protein